MKTLVILVMALSLSSCAMSEKAKQRRAEKARAEAERLAEFKKRDIERLKLIKPTMEKSEILDIFNDPQEVYYHDGKEVWVYYIYNNPNPKSSLYDQVFYEIAYDDKGKIYAFGINRERTNALYDSLDQERHHRQVAQQQQAEAFQRSWQNYQQQQNNQQMLNQQQRQQNQPTSIRCNTHGRQTICNSQPGVIYR